MIRFIIKRHSDNGRTVGTSSFETFDVDVPELESALTGGGHDHAGSYDVRELVGVEVLPRPARHPQQIAGVGCALCGKNEAGHYCTGACNG